MGHRLNGHAHPTAKKGKDKFCRSLLFVKNEVIQFGNSTDQTVPLYKARR